MNSKQLTDNSKAIRFAALAMIALGVAARLLPHPPNVAPITALALFGGVYLPKRYAFVIPIAAMLISDYFLGFHAAMPYVYGSFVISGLIGLWIREKKSVATVIGGSLFASIMFFLVTNFGVWAHPNSWYPPNFQGLMQSYFMGLPFFRNTILGDLGYAGLLFGGYELAKYLARLYLPTRLYRLAF